MLGAKSVFAEECHKGNYIGVNFLHEIDLSNELKSEWKEFTTKFIPVWMENHPDKSKIAAGLSCGCLWTILKGMSIGDIVLCPNGSGGYYVGEIASGYIYNKEANLPHQRNVEWYPIIIDRQSMSETLKRSTGSVGTVSDVSGYANEIELLIGSNKPPELIHTDSTIEDPSVFALEKHLEAFLVENWNQTELGKDYDILSVDGELVGQQYQTDTGAIDILAQSKDKKTLLVVELKKGRVSDNVVGQILRYMGFVSDGLAEEGQTVKGVIIGLEDDIRIKRALSAVNNIDFYKYQISFKLIKN